MINVNLHRYGLLCCSASFVISMVSSLVLAGQSAQSITDAGMPAQCSQYAAKVSASEGNWDSVNQMGCVGAFQFCPGTFEQYYNGTKAIFIDSPSSQVSSWTKYQQDEWGKAQRNGMTSLVGQQICYEGKCGTITESSILMACQFGCGKGGKLYNYSQGGDCNARNVKDGNLVSVCKYMLKGAGYDVSCFTGKQSTSASANCNPNDIGNQNLSGASVADSGTGQSGTGQQAAGPIDYSSPAEHPPTREMATIILESGDVSIEPGQMPEGTDPRLAIH